MSVYCLWKFHPNARLHFSLRAGQSHVSPDPGVASNRHFISTVFFLLLFLFLFLFLVIKINVAKASKPFGQCSLNSM